MRVLVLGGTSEAGALAQALAETGIDGVYSYAGRTLAPEAQPLPGRIGGFGGISGLVSYLQAESITHVVDATHPFAAQISRHAVAACHDTGIPLLALERPAWLPGPGDRWQRVPDLVGAVAALPVEPRRVFLAIGRQNLELFAANPQHHYLLRLVDPPVTALPLPRAEVVVSRGPFSLAGDLALLQDRRIALIVSKNAGGDGAEAKLIAARQLGLPVILVDRPVLPDRPRVASVAEVLDWLAHPATLGV